MDYPYKFIYLNTPLINLIKSLLVATSFILAAPVFVDVKQDLLGTCIDNYLAGDFDSALSSCIKPAAQEGADAQFLLGRMHFNGEGTLKDDKKIYLLAHQSG
jgi:TPR repeat protein